MVSRSLVYVARLLVVAAPLATMFATGPGAQEAHARSREYRATIDRPVPTATT